MSIAIPIVNAPNLYVDDLQLAWTDTTHFTVNLGATRNSTNVNDISLSAIVTVNSAITGAGGIDTGTIADSTLYDVYAIGDSLGYNNGSALISLASGTSPVLPLGYDMWRRIGSVLTDSSAHFLKFVQTGQDLTRTMWYDAGIVALNGGASATYATVSLAAYIPSSPIEVILNAVLTPTGNGNTASIKPNGATDAAGYVTIGGSQAAVATNAVVRCPCDSSAVIEYKVTGTLTLDVRGYLDQL